MRDIKYCYPNTNVLRNKLGIRDNAELLEAEKRLVALRLAELQKKPIRGKYDFGHLKAIHRHPFQDIYDWAGQERTVDIGKGNIFCLVSNLQSYGETVFAKYFSQCFAAKDDMNQFVKVFAENYGDLNALHPFREGNGRAQREFARTLCIKCGYDFNIICSTHREMIAASRLSFDKCDNSLLEKVFSRAVVPLDSDRPIDNRIIVACSL